MRLKKDPATGNFYDEESGRRVISPVFSPQLYRPRRRLSGRHAGTAVAVLLIGGWLGAAGVANGRTWEAVIAFGVTVLIVLGLFWPRS